MTLHNFCSDCNHSVLLQFSSIRFLLSDINGVFRCDLPYFEIKILLCAYPELPILVITPSKQGGLLFKEKKREKKNSQLLTYQLELYSSPRSSAILQADQKENNRTFEPLHDS